jgi:hypothetical protein
MMKKRLILGACLIGGVMGLGQAEASTLSFFCISSKVATDCAYGAAQLSVIVSNPTSNFASFTFKNNVGQKSSITEIYFDAASSSLSGSGRPTLTGSDSSRKNVAFSLDADPGSLPGGSSITPKFVTSNSDIFSADSDAGSGGQMAHGINTPGEWLTMDYKLKSGRTYADVMTELSNGKLRIGIHVTGFADGKSASFVNNPFQETAPAPTPVPVPAAAWLLGSGLLGLLGVVRRKQKA